MRAQPVLQTAHDLPFVFEGLRVLDAQLKDKKSDHFRLSAISLQLSANQGRSLFNAPPGCVRFLGSD